MSAGVWLIEWQQAGQVHRLPIEGVVRIGRSRHGDIVLDDPYASREHCTVSVRDGLPFVDGRGALNSVLISGVAAEMATLDDGGAFTVGQTVLRVRRSEALENDATLRLQHEAPVLTLRRSTRELVDRQGVLVAALSESEGAALAALALRYPDAASHEDLGHAVWGDLGYDRYQIHRLLTRLRQRLGDQAGLLENVRGAGYRLTGPIVVA